MTSGELESLFDRLLSRLPTDYEKQLLLRTQKELGISENDGLWLVLVVLGHYEQLYREMPEKIVTAGSHAIEHAKMRLAMETEAERKRLQGALTAAVLETIKETTVDRVKAERRRATAIAGGVCLVISAFISFVSYQWGFVTGHKLATEEQLWAASNAGRYARRLDEAGLPAAVKECFDRRGEFRITLEGALLCFTPKEAFWASAKVNRADLASD